MTDETNEVQETEEGNEDTGSSIDNLQDALKELEKVRKEAAKRRVQNKETEEKARQWEEHLQSQKTELERLTENNSKLAKENVDLRQEGLRDKIVAKTGLDPDLAEFLVGTEEEMEAKAKKLVAAKGKKDTTRSDFFAGQRGSVVGKDVEESSDALFAKLWNESSKSIRFK